MSARPPLFGGRHPVRLRPGWLAAVIAGIGLGAGLAAAEPPAPAPDELARAIAHFTAHRYPEAHDALARIVAAEPANAAAHHWLGRTLAARHDTPAVEEGLRHLARAAELEPRNAVYLGVYGGAVLRQAGRTRSPLAARRGRDALERALALDPDYLEAREGLFLFHERAPWPLASREQAAAQLAEIRRRDPDLATILSVGSRVNARDFPAAFQLCEEVLARQPDNYIALYHYGRTAAISGLHLERGLACLQRCLALEPPTAASPTHSHVSHRLGNVLEHLQRPAEARAAYQAALARDPGNRPAADALARLR